MNYGIQMYSIRDLAEEKGLKEALRAVAEIGYKSVEFAGFFDNTAEDVLAMLKEYDLKVSGSHSSFEELDADFAGTVKYHQAIGNKNYILPNAPISAAEELAETVKKINISPCLPQRASEWASITVILNFSPTRTVRSPTKFCRHKLTSTLKSTPTGHLSPDLTRWHFLKSLRREPL